MPPYYPTNKKLVAIGDGACGKTCLLIRFQRGDFPEEHVPTIFESYVADVQLNKEVLRLALFDTAGQEDYDVLRPIAYSDTHVLLICFDISNMDSLRNVYEKWIGEAEHYMRNVPIILVGCKSDLRKSKFPTVDIYEAEAIAARIKAKHYFECSAKTGENIENVFRVAAQLTVNPSKSCCTIL